MDALRIVAMSCIMMDHFMDHAQFHDDIPWGLFYVADPFFYVGLPVFFMISGHFGIRFSLRGLARLVLTILLFGLINFVLLEAVGWGASWDIIRESVMYPVTGSPYWFMQIYVMLYVTAPLINAGLSLLDNRTLGKLLLLWLVIIYYADTPLAKGSYMYGLYIYCTGYFCARANVSRRLRARWWLTGYIAACSLSGLTAWWLHRTGGDTSYLHSDNNVLMFIGALCLYLCFNRLTIRRHWISGVASAALGCYLLQDGWFGRIFFYNWQKAWIYAHGNYFRPDMIWMFALSFLAIWVASWLLTQGIGWLMSASGLRPRHGGTEKAGG